MIVGSEKDLVDRIDSTQSTLLVRAINDNEADQLLRDDSDSFQFNRGTEYETEYGEMVRMYAERRNGTVIVYQLQKGDTGTIFDENRKFDINRWALCVRTFPAPVEVYNVNGLNWEQLGKLRKKGTHMDKILKNFMAEVYGKQPLNTY